MRTHTGCAYLCLRKRTSCLVLASDTSIVVEVKVFCLFVCLFVPFCRCYARCPALRFGARSGGRVILQCSNMGCMLCGIFWILRCGEFLVPDGSDFDSITHLSLSDVSLDTSGNNWRFMLSLKVSKTDQFRKWALVVLGTTNSDLCPVAALLDYLVLRGQIPGAPFCLEDGRPLKRRVFTASVQQALTSSGLIGTQFNGDRIGAATTASVVGLPDSTIKSLGRWSSDAFQGYIRPSPEDLAGVASLLASKESPP